MAVITWIVGLWFFGVLFLGKRLRLWREGMTVPALKNWLVIAAVTSFLLIFYRLSTSFDNESVGWHINALSALCAWIAIISGYELLRRDNRERIQQQRDFESRLLSKTDTASKRVKASGQLHPPARSQDDPELQELLELEAEDEAASKGHISTARPTVRKIVINTKPNGSAGLSWPAGAAKVSVKGETTTVDLTELFFPSDKHPAEPAVAKPEQPAQQATKPQPATPQPKPMSDLTIASRFGSKAPAPTAPTTTSAQSGIAHTPVSYPGLAATKDTTGGQQAGPDRPSGNRFTYTPRIIDSKLGSRLPKPPDAHKPEA